MGFGGFLWMSPLYPMVLDVRMSLLGSLIPRSTAWLACHPVVRPRAWPGSGRPHRSLTTARSDFSACVEGRARTGHLTFVEGPAGGRGLEAHGFGLPGAALPSPLQPGAPVRPAWGPRGALCRPGVSRKAARALLPPRWPIDLRWGRGDVSGELS